MMLFLAAGTWKKAGILSGFLEDHARRGKGEGWRRSRSPDKMAAWRRVRAMNHQFTFEMPDHAYALVCEAAEQAGMTVEEYILDTIRESLARHPQGQDMAENREEQLSG
ncbi:hypothetical protein [Rhizobium sp. SL86]|uniref:hypothetical protein n=1 Tax=Rhizobium sp. SL86 TaxID=2995148 RepID=UPI0022725FEA|nr:hypothetical protein [Rhizobium sp. SL86]MCY1664554.1 hypothetical protein [Rhizobium sp. SL86]